MKKEPMTRVSVYKQTRVVNTVDPAVSYNQTFDMYGENGEPFVFDDQLEITTRNPDLSEMLTYALEQQKKVEIVFRLVEDEVERPRRVETKEPRVFRYPIV